MPSSSSLRPLDVGVLLHLHLNPGASYGAMAEGLGLSKSSAHASVSRLVRSGLAAAVGRSGVRSAPGPMLEFLQFGVPYAFPAETVPKARGIPTGFSEPSLRALGPVGYILASGRRDSQRCGSRRPPSRPPRISRSAIRTCIACSRSSMPSARAMPVNGRSLGR